MKIYKYLSPDVIDLVFPEPGKVAFKCTYPKDFNDPYELFLTINPHDVDDEIVAYYQEILGDLPQMPTSCFSRLPNVIPMWAHYANNSEGFVVEVGEDELQKIIPNVSVDDVDYEDEANIVDVGLVHYAYETGKPRHTYLLQRSAFSKAYFTKNICWSYEAERRLIVDDSAVKKFGDYMILSLPVDCITAIIAGPRSKDALMKRCIEISDDTQCDYYEMRIGKSSILPFFLDAFNETYMFNGDEINVAEFSCDECGEPIKEGDVNICNWCKIDDEHLHAAASKNPMRILHKYGLLEGYVEAHKKIRDKT